MCGLAGIFAYADHPPALNQEALLRMSDNMQRRGPDGEGVWISDDQCIGLAHRRLSIIDLSEDGAQPMIDLDTGNRIVFNGEIYNYKDLRAELIAAGHRFRSHSDTEVLLKLYAEHGQQMLHQLRGMFAFAIWDQRKRTLFLARNSDLRREMGAVGKGLVENRFSLTSFRASYFALMPSISKYRY